MFTRSDLETKKLLWLLTLRIRGRSYRFSTEPAVCTWTHPQKGPDLLQFVSGLEFLSYEDTVELFDTKVSEREVSLSVLFAQAMADGWDSIADPAKDIGSGSGELALMLAGDDFADRQVIVKGYIEEPTHGTRYEPVEFTLTESDHKDTARIPATQAKVTPLTWPLREVAGNTIQADDGALGQFYPVVFGEPGRFAPPDWSGLGTGFVASTPALLVQIDTTAGHNMTNPATLVIAGHETYKTGSGGTVQLFNESNKTTRTGTPIHTTDARGRMVTALEYSAPPASPDTAPAYVAPGTEIWIAWSDCAGVPNTLRTGPMVGAGEIIEYLLERSALRIDTLRSRAVLQEVNNIQLDFWFNEPRSPFETIIEDILPCVPLSPQIRPDGLGFVYWNWSATAADASEDIDMSRINSDRLSSVEVSAVEDVYNEITIQYCPDGPGGKFRKSLTYSHDPDFSDLSQMRNPYAFASFTRYGHRGGLVIEAPAVCRDETASQILDWRIRRHAQTHRTVTYRVPQAYQSLEVGDVVTLTDSEISWDQVVCLVTGIVRVPGSCEITITTVSNWARDAF